MQELREPARYNSIIRAIANGATKRSEIASKAQLSSSELGPYLEKLMGIDIVEKQLSLFETSTKKFIYSLKDSFFSFWYRFIPQNLDNISLRYPEEAWITIEPFLSEWLGPQFERIVYEWCFENRKNLPFSFQTIGRWWGNNPLEKRQEEIDLIAYKDEQALFIECKYRNDVNLNEVKQELVRKSNLFPQFKEKYYLPNILQKRLWKDLELLHWMIC